jgi:hypothetical protein
MPNPGTKYEFDAVILTAKVCGEKSAIDVGWLYVSAVYVDALMARR